MGVECVCCHTVMVAGAAVLEHVYNPGGVSKGCPFWGEGGPVTGACCACQYCHQCALDADACMSDARL
jgi:hypothetical protein